MSDTISKLKDLKELLDGGALTQDEFDAQKAVLLGNSKITQVAPAPVVGQPRVQSMRNPGGLARWVLDQTWQWLLQAHHRSNGDPDWRKRLPIFCAWLSACKMEKKKNVLSRRGCFRW